MVPSLFPGIAMMPTTLQSTGHVELHSKQLFLSGIDDFDPFPPTCSSSEDHDRTSPRHESTFTPQGMERWLFRVAQWGCYSQRWLRFDSW